MQEIELKVQTEKARAGLYMDAELYDEFCEFADDHGVSFNQAAIYLMRLGMESLEEE
jgi:hypothetical protein